MKTILDRPSSKSRKAFRVETANTVYLALRERSFDRFTLRTSEVWRYAVWAGTNSIDNATAPTVGCAIVGERSGWRVRTSPVRSIAPATVREFEKAWYVN